MRSLSQRATAALIAICLFFALIVAVIGVVGVISVRSATHVGNSVTDDEVFTAITTAEVGRNIGTAYATGEEALATPNAKGRSVLVNAVYAKLVPAVDRGIADLESLHDGDSVAERNGITLLQSQWTSLRSLLDPAALAAGSGHQPTLAGRLVAVYQPLGAHIAQLIVQEQDDARAAEARVSSSSAVRVWLIAALAAAGLAAAAALGVAGSRRVRRAVEPEQDQLDFAETLQIAADEEEAHQLLQRHLERTLSDTTAVVLNRNNSADRLEAVTPLSAESPLITGLRGAEPRSCLAVRSGRTWSENRLKPGLLTCSVCAACPGHSSCSPLTVGGEVIGAVLLNRTTPYYEAEEVRIRESVSQAAPVLANLRNLAIAEILAATDGLTGLPNKRAVTDALKRLFAQSARTGSPLTLVLLDLDHFKLINDRLGHPVGDQVLANVGAALRASLRVGDFAGRNGGEEFALILPETSVADGYEIAQRVRLAIAEITIAAVDVTVTASLGVAGYPDHAGSPERLERLADAALYVAKRSGRNRTEMADPTHEPAAVQIVPLNARIIQPEPAD
jgi:diguanylate cyclase (GGDEF)-like protein